MTLVITRVLALISHSSTEGQGMLFDLISAGSRLTMGFSCSCVVPSLRYIHPPRNDLFMCFCDWKFPSGEQVLLNHTRVRPKWCYFVSQSSKIAYSQNHPHWGMHLSSIWDKSMRQLMSYCRPWAAWQSAWQTNKQKCWSSVKYRALVRTSDSCVLVRQSWQSLSNCANQEKLVERNLFY